MTKLEITAVKIRQALNNAFPHDKADYFTSAIITAAGSGVRMGGVDKAFYELDGEPCLSYVLSAFQKCEGINEIIVTAKKESVDKIIDLAKLYGISKLKKVVPGGETRQESVRNGFFAIDPKADLVAIHDGDRPLILPSGIERVLKEARRYGAATASCAVTDSVKRSNGKGMIEESVPRDDLFLVQTPQVFLCDLYRVSLALAKDKGVDVTDDNALAQFAGFKVKLTPVPEENYKLTVPEDAEKIERILKVRKYENV